MDVFMALYLVQHRGKSTLCLLPRVCLFRSSNFAKSVWACEELQIWQLCRPSHFYCVLTKTLCPFDQNLLVPPKVYVYALANPNFMHYIFFIVKRTSYWFYTVRSSIERLYVYMG